jgi:hypothetical protein
MFMHSSTVPPHTLISHSVSFFAYLFAAALHHYDYFYSRISSSTLLFFWLLNLSALLISIRTSILLNLHFTDTLIFAFETAGIIITSFAFLIFMIPKPADYYRSLDDGVNVSPEETANVFSRLVFHWYSWLTQDGPANETGV